MDLADGRSTPGGLLDRASQALGGLSVLDLFTLAVRGGEVASWATMKPLIALVVAAVLATFAFGTAQVPDRLILDGKEVPLFENPLEFLWVDETGTPVLFSSVFSEPPTTPEERKRMDEFYDRRPEAFRKGGGSSANWRGYVATWQIEGPEREASGLRRVVFWQGPGTTG
ncbi:MAG: hypothetical protein IPL39_24545 [Opitutaceae bacterium]|nr:hypothetical protein [Opitutaceae bacterium]